MFRYFTVPLNTSMLELSELHPSILEALLEFSWNSQISNTAKPLGHPDRRSDVRGRPNQMVSPTLAFTVPRIPPATGTVNVPGLAGQIATGTLWPHLIYSYMIENTKVLEVFRRVIDNFLHGERLSLLSPAAQRWLWTTEELFYRDPPSFSIATQTSSIRPDLRAVRGNAYQRMFGMSLNIADGNGKPAVPIAEHANVDFVSVLDDLLHEIWQGRTNFSNNVGARPTDDAKIAQLAERLCDMLRGRRSEGTLSREEFWAGATMSWFHATLSEPLHPIVVDLRAQATSAEERLFKIAQRVGYPAHGLSKSYFEIAEPLSRLLVGIEAELYNSQAAVPALYTPPSTAAADTDVIKTHWSIIRGRDVKAKKVHANA